MLDKVRAEVRRQKVTGYRVAKETGISEPAVSRFLNGAGVRAEHLDRMAQYLGLELVRSDELAELRRLKREG